MAKGKNQENILKGYKKSFNWNPPFKPEK